MKSRNKTTLLLALAICYFGDYCAFVSLLEISRRVLGDQASVLTFLVYSVPALVMLAAANLWAKAGLSEKKQLVYVNLAGFLISVSLAINVSQYWILFSALALGLIKEVARTLVNGLIKKFFDPSVQGDLVTRAVTIRFVVMIVGGSFGAYLASGSLYKIGFLSQGATFLIAAALISTLSLTGHAPSEEPKSQTAASIGIRGFIKKMDSSVIFLFSMSLIAVGAFMSVEYPLLVGGLGVDPKWIGLVYVGHVLGAIYAQYLLIHKLKSASPARIMLLSVAQIVSFMLVGLVSRDLAVLSLQIGLCAFVMVLFESQTTSYLMKFSSEAEYPLYNIWLRSLGLLSEFLGSLVAFALLFKFSLIDTNVLVAACCVVLSLLAMVIAKTSIRSLFKSASLMILVVMSMGACHSSLTSDTKGDVTEVNARITSELNRSLDAVQSGLELLAKQLSEKLDAQTADAKGQKIEFSTVYFPKRAKAAGIANIKNSVAFLDPLFNEFTGKHSFISWVYFYDNHTKMLLIHPATNAQVLFGEDLIFDEFDFYKTAVKQYPIGAFTDFKDDINGTGKIVIYTQAVKSKAFPNSNFSLSVDVGINRLFKNAVSASFAQDKSLSKRKYISIGYTKSGDSFFIVDKYAIDSGVFQPQVGNNLSTEADLIKAIQKLERDGSTLAKGYICHLDKAAKVKLYSVFCVEK